MPPRRSRGFADIRQLRDVPREQFLEFVKALQENPELLNTTATRHRWDQDAHRRFDSVVVRGLYELEEGEGTFTLESCDPREMVQPHVFGSSQASSAVLVGT